MSRPAIDLAQARHDVTRYYENLADRDGATGAYRLGIGKRPDLYASADVAIMRAVMGEDLQKTLSDSERRAWVEHINSFERRFGTGEYGDTHGHHPLHANGMVIGALGPLGGRQPSPVALYDDFDSADKVAAWLERVDWSRQWRGSHQFWGGMHCFSFSARCSRQWLDTVFDWLDAELDHASGWWRRGVAFSDRHQPLGGSVHIIPIYQHHGRTFPCPERVIDSTLALQLPSGRWLANDTPHVMHYLELDALYALKLMGNQVPTYRRGDIDAALDSYIALAADYWLSGLPLQSDLHPHQVLAAVGVLGLLQQHRPEQFPDQNRWTDIFSDRRFYQTEAVEVLAPEWPGEDGRIRASQRS